jgi:hypothetical protein
MTLSITSFISSSDGDSFFLTRTISPVAILSGCLKGTGRPDSAVISWIIVNMMKIIQNVENSGCYRSRKKQVEANGKKYQP